MQIGRMLRATANMASMCDCKGRRCRGRLMHIVVWCRAVGAIIGEIGPSVAEWLLPPGHALTSPKNLIDGLMVPKPPSISHAFPHSTA